MSHLTPSETKSNFYFITFFYERLGCPHLNFIVVIINIWSYLDFLNLDNFLFLSSFVRLFLLLILVLSKVRYFTHRRNSVWANLEKIHTYIIGTKHCLTHTHDTKHLTILVNEAHLRHTNVFVNSRSVASWKLV